MFKPGVRCDGEMRIRMEVGVTCGIMGVLAFHSLRCLRQPTDFPWEATKKGCELVCESVGVEFVKKVNIKISLCSELKTFFIKHLPRSFAIQSRMDSLGVVPPIDIFENQREQLFSLD